MTHSLYRGIFSLLAFSRAHRRKKMPRLLPSPPAYISLLIYLFSIHLLGACLCNFLCLVLSLIRALVKSLFFSLPLFFWLRMFYIYILLCRICNVFYEYPQAVSVLIPFCLILLLFWTAFTKALCPFSYCHVCHQRLEGRTVADATECNIRECPVWH